MKSGHYFRFKQFNIAHDRCIHKVGTDGVLLGAWVNIENCQTILDIGTGSGVIALMLAQRTADQPTTRIDAVELEAADAAQAHDNAMRSPWASRIQVHHTAIQEFQPGTAYDLIVSNPPFFNNSLKPPGERRGQTRHTTTLDHQALIHHVIRLLAPRGTFNVILPVAEGTRFIALAGEAGLYTTRQHAFRTRGGKPVERWLLEFGKVGVTTVEEGEVLLYSQGQTWADSYRNLTLEFYLQK